METPRAFINRLILAPRNITPEQFEARFVKRSVEALYRRAMTWDAKTWSAAVREIQND